MESDNVKYDSQFQRQVISHSRKFEKTRTSSKFLLLTLPKELSNSDESNEEAVAAEEYVVQEPSEAVLSSRAPLSPLNYKPLT